jgi:hypothetical protein
VRTRLSLAVLSSGLLLATGVAVGGAVADQARVGRAPAGVCAGVGSCRVVAHVDVTGDAAPDAVGLVRRGKDGAEKGTVTVRVRTSTGRIVTATHRTQFWHGSQWQGAGRLDGRAGRELVVGRIQGAHAQFFTVLTWRKKQLVNLDAPGRGHSWGIDGAVSVDLGWQHRVGDPRGVIRKRSAVRQGNATQGSFRGTIRTFRWTRSGWARIGTKVVSPMSDEKAARWGGWRVRGIDRW